MTDAVVIGSGPNGLVAANQLADSGWSVTVIEEAGEPGGAVRSGELIESGYVHDLFSAFYPFARASPHIEHLDLERWGLRWCTAELALAHPARDGSCPVISLQLDETAAVLDALSPGDGRAWRDLYARWERVRAGALRAFFEPFPPLRGLGELGRTLGPVQLARVARFAMLPVTAIGARTFAGEPGTRLVTGNALHADVGPDTVPSGAFGWVLSSLAQEHGFPAVQGGAGQLTAALVARLLAHGGELHTGQRATRIECRAGRAVAVRTEDARWAARRAVIADVGAPQLYRELLGTEALSPRFRRQLERFEYDSGTFKVDWTLEGPIPWTAPDARRAATVHVGDGLSALRRYATELKAGLIPAQPYLVLGQYAAFDRSRAPAGKETAWAYTHVPQRIAGDAGGELTGSWNEAETVRFADRIEAQVEALAPGFRALIRARHVYTPLALQRANRNLVGGALGGGSARLRQQLVFRPVLSLGRPETPVDRVYLGSASAHPGGAVHGGPGANAAAAALAREQRWRPRLAGRAAVAIQRL
jgi:phytoene dehydrogenase-like protein